MRPIDFHSIEWNLWKSVGTRSHLVAYILQTVFRRQERNSYRFGTTWGWVLWKCQIFFYFWV